MCKNTGNCKENMIQETSLEDEQKDNHDQDPSP